MRTSLSGRHTTAERRWDDRGTGAERPPDSTKGPRRWKAPQDVTSCRLSRVGGHGDLGGFFTRETIAKRSTERKRPKAERRPCPTSAEEGDATEVSEAWSIAGAVGRKRPRCSLRTPVTAHEENRQKQAARVSLRSAEAFSSVVKTLGPPVKHRSPRLLCPPRGESRGASRERTKYGCT